MIEYYKNLSLENLFYIDENGVLQDEEWKDIPNYEGFYKISNLGRIKTLQVLFVNRNGTITTFKERIRRQSVSSNKYLTLRLTKNKVSTTFTTHQLLAIAFLNHVVDGHKTVVDHWDDNRLNNVFWNLRLVTHRENDSKKKGGTSKYTGVFLRKDRGSWTTVIYIHTKQLRIASFKTEETANMAYQIALTNIEKYDGDDTKFREFIKEQLKLEGWI